MPARRTSALGPRGRLSLALVAGTALAACALWSAGLETSAPAATANPAREGAHAAARRAPTVDELVVFRSGRAYGGRVRASAVTVRVGRRRCAVGVATPLAALVRGRPGRLGLKDYGSCSRRAADAGGLYVRSIRGDRGRGQNGWIYKVGNRQANAGAGDPAGPFGRGRLRNGQRVTWYYCRYRRGCQRTLALRAEPQPGGVTTVRVRGYDDAGKGVAVAGATVAAGSVATATDPAGIAQLRLPPGRHTLRAAKVGLVRSFDERVTVRP